MEVLNAGLRDRTHLSSACSHKSWNYVNPPVIPLQTSICLLPPFHFALLSQGLTCQRVGVCVHLLFPALNNESTATSTSGSNKALYHGAISNMVMVFRKKFKSSPNCGRRVLAFLFMFLALRKEVGQWRSAWILANGRDPPCGMSAL